MSSTIVRPGRAHIGFRLEMMHHPLLMLVRNLSIQSVILLLYSGDKGHGCLILHYLEWHFIYSEEDKRLDSPCMH